MKMGIRTALLSLRVIGAAFVVFCLLATLLAGQARAGDLAEYIPPDTMIYFSWDFSEGVEANYHKSALYKFLQEEEIKTFLEQQIFDGADMFNLGDDNPLTNKEMLKLGRTRAAMWISDIKERKVKGTDEEYGDYEYTDEVALGGIIAEFLTDDAKKAADKLIKYAEEKVAEEGNLTKQIIEYKKISIKHYKSEDGGDFEETCFFKTDDGKYVLTSSLDEAKKVIRLLKDKDAESLAENALYGKTIKNLRKDRVVTGFLNLEIILNKYKKDMFENEIGEKVNKYLQLGDAKALGLAAVASGDQLGLEFYLFTPGSNSPFFKLFRNSRPGFKSMELVKKEALIAFVGSFKPLDWWEFYKKCAEIVDEGSFDEEGGFIKKFEKESGRDFEKDFLANIGPEAAIIIPDTAIDLTSSVPLGVVLAVQIKDKEKIQEFIKAAVAKNNLETEGVPFRGYKILRFGKDVLFCLTEKYWLIGSSEEAVKEVIKTLRGDRTLLVNSEEYRKARQKIEGDITVLGHINLARLFEMVNSLTQKFGKNKVEEDIELEEPSEPESGKSDDRKREAQLFPINLLKKYFSSLLVVLKTDENGMLFKVIVP